MIVMIPHPVYDTLDRHDRDATRPVTLIKLLGLIEGAGEGDSVDGILV